MPLRLCTWKMALGIVAGCMNRTVDREAGGIDLVGRCHHLVAGEIDLDQTRGGDLVEHHAVGIDQEVMLGPRHARREVREDEVVPMKMRDQSIGCGKRDARVPTPRAKPAREHRLQSWWRSWQLLPARYRKRPDPSAKAARRTSRASSRRRCRRQISAIVRVPSIAANSASCRASIGR